MTVSPFFDHHGNSEETAILDSIIVEMIQACGENMLYVPRRVGKLDEIYTEDSLKYYDTAYELEFYLQNVDGFEGLGSFLTNLAPMLQDQLSLQVSISRFEEVVGQNESFSRPREGDLIWFPKNQKMFEIVFADKFKMMYPLGQVYLWNLTCQLYEYSSERFITGVTEIDQISSFSADQLDYVIYDHASDPLKNPGGDYLFVTSYSEGDMDPLDQSDEIEEEADEILDFSESDPFSEGEL